MSPGTCARATPFEPAGDHVLIAGLWEEAPFARLPADAPSELENFVQDIEDPRRVYAIHRASRRHGFQLLVAKFIIQLRNGCGETDCRTPTCYSWRKHMAGKVPLRRYNLTSARTLAAYLASQDEPQKALCPYLELDEPTDAPAAVNTLIFSTRPPPSPRGLSKLPRDLRDLRGSRKQKPVGEACPKTSPHRDRHPNTDRHVVQGSCKCSSCGQKSPKPDNSSPNLDVCITEQPQSKDHRSFAANLFGTVAFKMLEWLTPRGVESISQHIARLDVDHVQNDLTKPDTAAPVEDLSSFADTSTEKSTGDRADIQPGRGQANRSIDGSGAGIPPPGSGPSQRDQKVKTRSRNGPTSRPRAASSPRTKRTMSLEPFSPTGVSDDPKSAVPPRANGFYPEKPPRHPKTTGSVLGRGIPEVPTKPAFFENVPPPTLLSAPKAQVIQVSEPSTPGGNSIDQPTPGPEPQERASGDNAEIESHDHEDEPTDLLGDALPQSLSRLNVTIIDFICDVFQEDGTSEAFLPPPFTTQVDCPEPKNKPKALARKRLRNQNEKRMRKQWKEFNEQAIFTILSDPHDLIRSFTQDGQLYDSQSLCYCFHRMTRAAPSLVFHSLWIAAGGLLTHQRFPAADVRPKPRSRRGMAGLTSLEAGYLMAICMHALVAVSPMVSDSTTMYEMSRYRSKGLTLVGGGAISRQQSSRCVEYEDAFSNQLAIRLAQRLFCAIPLRRHSMKVSDRALGRSQPTRTIDVLQPLLRQLDFLSNTTAPILEFSDPERLLHEVRGPTVILDWARTVLLKEWDGRTEVFSNSPFGGALALIETMHENRSLLLLGDIQFRVDYFSERLDSIEIPVDWLSYRSSSHRKHLLDYPYIFSPETRVSFFRSINFARMSRMFEESSSLKTRMSAIVDPGSLITNPHHKMVLQDLLKTASSKYLVLEIGRENVARDAFDQLWRREKRELLRPLKVHLGEEGGEEGFDSGGVQQEFFRLAIAECLDPKYGAFTVDERTKMAWFAPGSLNEDWRFELVGLLVSLALYNGLTLPVTFPKALYRKLLGEPTTELHHIADGWPDLANGLTQLLEWDEANGSVEDVFARTYEFSISAFGSNVSREMTKDGGKWPKAAAGQSDSAPPSASNPEDAPLVTNDNRDAYVSDYIRYLTDVSVRPQFRAFQRGFQACLDKKSLSLLTPPILQSLVEGVQEIDISELRRYARYVGWDGSHHTIRDFWSIVKRYDDGMKRRLLEFVTSSDRVPVGGMKNLQFVVQKNGEEEGEGGHLPTAYTCYGTLLLPEYRDKEVLRERLAMALENAQGFGFA